jgi:activator of HSP90 ATPase
MKISHPQVLAAAFALSGLAASASSAPAAAPEAPAGLSIHQELLLDAAPAEVYSVLLDSKRFSALTGGAVAEIHPEAGGTFSCFGGQIVGRNIELLPQKRIVQAWRVAAWPEGFYSIVRFDLEAHGSGTRVVFDHTAFPPDQRDHLAAGWEDHYFKPLRTLK